MSRNQVKLELESITMSKRKVVIQKIQAKLRSQRKGWKSAESKGKKIWYRKAMQIVTVSKK